MLIRGDARFLPLRDETVDCVVTSVPYYGLRDYGHELQIGREASLAAYVDAIGAVFQEVWRVLKADGVLWLNIGDSYAGSRGGGQGQTGQMADRSVAAARCRQREWTLAPEHKSKDLLGVPWRVAFALQAAGWYLRSDVIWSKPNPLPESVMDRPTKAHEYVFMLTKSGRYHFDKDAVCVPYDPATLKRGKSIRQVTADGQTVYRFNGEPLDEASIERGRNIRSVWHIPTLAYEGAHFATMPEKLVEPCILAGCPLGGLVLDPFVGSGTVVAVAQRLGRKGVGVDLSYQDLAKKRTAQRGLPLEVA
jgi:DNA modification methylase